jgi:hypothetical protein
VKVLCLRAWVEAEKRIGHLRVNRKGVWGISMSGQPSKGRGKPRPYDPRSVGLGPALAGWDKPRRGDACVALVSDPRSVGLGPALAGWDKPRKGDACVWQIGRM